ncbi:MAG TPA: bifunctional folylpolyglutamate synthase/dihydrofolate synthase [Firmicutes bacterium]|nr:bifunctional folylpolyglutamate synthase/dihydrofolate synthase [Bacillota bacterium]
MTYSEALEFIHSRPRLGRKKPGTQRMEKLLHALGDPHKTLKFVHIAGTNGKGSVTAMTSNILRLAGYKTGQFISPFILEFRERIQMNGEMIPKEKLVEYAQQVKAVVDEMDARDEIINEFEIDTAIGLLWFAEERCDIVCLEVGLGGLYDATNIIDAPLVTAITSISLDHTNLLGDTTAKIAQEKCGIIKRGSVVVSYPTQDKDALAVVMERCAALQVPVILPAMGGVEILDDSVLHKRVRYGNLEFTLKLPGAHQVQNAMMVVEIIRQLAGKGFPVSEETIQKGIETVFFPARQEILSEHPLILLDGAHNFSGAQSLEDTLRRLPQEKTMIIGMLSDKDYEHSAQLLARQCRCVITVSPDNPRALSPEQLAQAVGDSCETVIPCHDYEKALNLAKSQAGETGAIIICGSLYLASSMRELLCKKK